MSAFAASRFSFALCVSVCLAACSGGRSGGGGYAPLARGAPSLQEPAVTDRVAPPVAEEPAFPAPAAPTTAEAAVEPAPVPAGPFTLAGAGLRAPTPAGWRTRRKASALVFEGPMRLPSVALFNPQESATFQGAVDGLATELSTPLGNVRITRAPTETTLAGYRAYVAEGTGRAEGFPMRWRATIVDTERPTIILGLAPSFFWGGNAGKIREFERSIQKVPLQTASLGRTQTAGR
jgi:hypothetical protein